MDLADRKLKCTECGEMLVFSAGEQQFFRDKGIQSRPKTLETHVKGSECGIDTTVPFKPTGKRPVLCSSCFKSS
jgi:CxxC-x17-CxxC domain-containing protein